MSIEVEIKLKIRDKNRLIESLRDVGFQQGDLVSESDIYYTSRHHDFEKLDEALRIRSIQNLSTGEKSSVITFKGAKTDKRSMTRKELETEVGDPKIAREVLESIGFIPEFEMIGLIMQIGTWMNYDIQQQHIPYDGEYTSQNEILVPNDMNATVEKLTSILYGDGEIETESETESESESETETEAS